MILEVQYRSRRQRPYGPRLKIQCGFLFERDVVFSDETPLKQKISLRLFIIRTL
jgi:hypothetical protein